MLRTSFKRCYFKKKKEPESGSFFFLTATNNFGGLIFEA